MKLLVAAFILSLAFAGNSGSPVECPPPKYPENGCDYPAEVSCDLGYDADMICYLGMYCMPNAKTASKDPAVECDALCPAKCTSPQVYCSGGKDENTGCEWSGWCMDPKCRLKCCIYTIYKA